MNPRDGALAVLVMALWGANFVAVKLTMHSFEPMFLLTIRYALVAAMLMPFAKPVNRTQFKGLFQLSIALGVLHFPLIFLGVRGVDAAVGALVIQLQVPFSSIIAAILFKDYLGWRRALGMALAFGGILVIAGEPHGESSTLHIMFIAGAALAFSIANLIIKKIGALDGFTMSGWLSLMAMPQVFIISLLIEDGQWASLTNATPTSWVALCYVVIGSSVVGYGIWYRLARVHPINHTMPFLLLVPVFGVLSGVFMLGEPVTTGLLIGGAMTIAGIAIIMFRRPKVTADPKAGSIS